MQYIPALTHLIVTLSKPDLQAHRSFVTSPFYTSITKYRTTKTNERKGEKTKKKRNGSEVLQYLFQLVLLCAIYTASSKGLNM